VTGKKVDRLVHYYGRISRPLYEGVLEAVNRKVFVKKALAKVPDIGYVCARIIVQIAIHNIGFAIRIVLPPLLGSKGSGLIVALNALVRCVRFQYQSVCVCVCLFV